jgi:hypothetical protein
LLVVVWVLVCTGQVEEVACDIAAALVLRSFELGYEFKTYLRGSLRCLDIRIVVVLRRM